MSSPSPIPARSVAARSDRVETLHLDLVGPCPGYAFARELLKEAEGRIGADT